MRLSEKESTILAAAELRADASMALLRKESGYREHTVRYALKRLTERKVITPVPFINLHRLGLTIYTLFFSIGAEKKGTREGVLKSLMNSPDVLWVGEFGGEYHYGIGFCAKHISPLVEYLNKLSSKHSTFFFDKAIAIQISSTIFPRKYLSSKKFSVKPLTVTYTKEIVKIDETDARILSGLTTYSELSHRQLAMKLKIPLSTLELRVKKLRENQVIAGNVFIAEPGYFQMQAFKLLVFTKGLNMELTGELFKFCSQHRNITYLIDCIGTWGYEIGVEVERPEEVTNIIQEIYEAFTGSINTIKVLTKFRYPKVRWFPGMSD